jgi:hypothetical protein
MMSTTYAATGCPTESNGMTRSLCNSPNRGTGARTIEHAMPSSAFGFEFDGGATSHASHFTTPLHHLRSGSSSSIHVSDDERQARCPESSRWMAAWLYQSGVKAYGAQVNVFDPKQRRHANQIDHWCYGDRVKLWDALDRRPIPSLSAQHAFDMQRALVDSDAGSHALAHGFAI